MLSYHADMDIHTNPFELGLDRLVNLDTDAEFIGKQALKAIRDAGVTRKQVGVVISGEPLAMPNTRAWPLFSGEAQVGHVTSAVYSPRLRKNIALATVSAEYALIGTDLTMEGLGEQRRAEVVEKPFYDPKKQLAASTSVIGAPLNKVSVEVALPDTPLVDLTLVNSYSASESGTSAG